MKLMTIKPKDNIFVGSGKRFAKGENNWVQSKAIPSPSVFHGAIASLMLSLDKNRKNEYLELINKYRKERNKKNADKSKVKKLQEKYKEKNPKNFITIDNIYLTGNIDKNAHNINKYIPAPLDLFINDKGYISYGKFKKISPCYSTSFNDELEYLLDSCEPNTDRVESMFIDRASFFNSYFKMSDSISCINKDEIFSSAYKVGIEIDYAKGTVKDEHLYRLDLCQFINKNWSYAVKFDIESKWWSDEDINLDRKGLLKLGGEHKPSIYELKDVKNYKDDIVNNYINDNEFVKMYFYTPAVFKNNSYKPEFDNDIKVVGAFTDKPQYVGGFDMAEGKSKPMYKVVPAGAVYLLKSDKFRGEKLESIKELIKNSSFVRTEHNREGFCKFEIVPVFQKQFAKG